MRRRDGFESPLISAASLFTSLSAAGQINRLERGREDIHIQQQQERGKNGREFGRKLLKLLLSTPQIQPMLLCGRER